jgi:hypothetical protein
MLIELPPVRATSVPGEFDAKRAKARLAAILGDERPHPADSDASDAVRDRLIAQLRSLGLSPVVRDQFACNELHKQRGVACARVRNVIVALGPQSGPALLLNTHYDSNPSGPGAADAGAGVASMLEAAAILKDEPLRRPLILLFNEGEELGLVGARAFLSDPLSRRVDSLINLEARGTTGPVSMFETNLPNGPPVRAFAQAVDRPYANSLATDFYRQLPNYTDVNSFSERGWLTLNFAMIGNETRYHSAGDDLAALDGRSLQHMGDQALAVARHLSASGASGGGTLLFADIAGRQLVSIPQWTGIALLALLVAGLGVTAFRRGGLWRGLAVFAGTLALSAASAWLGIWALGMARPGSFWRAYPLWTHLAVYSCGLAAAVVMLAFFGKRLARSQLRAASWLGFTLVGGIVLLIAPGGIIYFLFPPLVALAGIVLAKRWSWIERATAIAAALLLWVTLGEMLALLGELLNNGPFFMFAPIAALIALPWLIEAKGLVDETPRRRAVLTSLLVMLSGWGAAAAAPAYSSDRQQRFAIHYVRDAAGGRAWWAVDNDGAPLPDRFGAGWSREKLPHLSAPLRARAAPLVETPAVQATVVRRSTVPGGRAVTLRITSGGLDRVALIAPEDSRITAAGSGAFLRPISADAKDGRYVISCTGRSCDGAELTLVTAKDGPIPLLVAGVRYALPSQAAPLVAARPERARPQYSPDQTVTLSRISL